MPLGMGDDCRLLLLPFDEYLAGFLKHVCKDRTCSSYNDYRKWRNRLAALLEYESRVKDIPFKELKRDFDAFVFKHKDLPIVSLRVDEQGRKISDPHEYDRSMSVLRICNQNCKHADRIGSICNKAYHICNNRYRNVAHDRLFLSYQNKSTNLI